MSSRRRRPRRTTASIWASSITLITSRDTFSATLAAQDSPQAVPVLRHFRRDDGQRLPGVGRNRGVLRQHRLCRTPSRRRSSTRRASPRSATTTTRISPSARSRARRSWESDITPDLVDGPTNINLEGSGMFAGYNPFGPANIVDNTFTFTNDLSWTKSKHSLQVRLLRLGLSRCDDLRLLSERRVRLLRSRHARSVRATTAPIS